MPRRKCDCGECRLCKHRAYMAVWSAKHRDEIREWKKEWYERNAERVRERVASYRAENIEQIRLRDRERDRRPSSPEKRRARSSLQRAIQRGEITPQPCEVCGEFPILDDGRRGVHGHHDDYSKPLDVRWLCHRHHGEIHRKVA